MTPAYISELWIARLSPELRKEQRERHWALISVSQFSWSISCDEYRNARAKRLFGGSTESVLDSAVTERPTAISDSA